MHKHRNDYNTHHIIGQKNRIDYNVDLPINKIIVEIAKHDALNCLAGTNQDPKSQLNVMVEEWRYNVLSEKAKQLFDVLITMPDNEFYKKELLKKSFINKKKHDRHTKD
jgi:hypothetical protein